MGNEQQAAAIVAQFIQDGQQYQYNERPIDEAILQQPAALRAAIVVSALTSAVDANEHFGFSEDNHFWIVGHLGQLISRLLRSKLPFDEPQVERVLEAMASEESNRLSLGGLIAVVERHVNEQGLGQPIVAGLEHCCRRLSKFVGYSAEFRRIHERLQKILRSDDETGSSILPGVWGDDVLAWLAELPKEKASAWQALFAHAALAAGKSKPTQKWRKKALLLVEAVGEAELAAAMIAWLETVKLGPSSRSEWGPDVPQGPSEHNQDVLKGLVWCCALVANESLAHSVRAFAERCFRKIPNFGAASQKHGNACLYVLSQLPPDLGVAHLSRLATKVRYASAKRLIEKALDEVAERAGKTREDIEELAVPDFGLSQDGKKQITVGDHVAELSVIEGLSVQLVWKKTDSEKVQKTVPKAVKEQFPDQLKAVKKQVKELGDLLAGQAARIEALYLKERRLPYADLRQRYLEHPLVGQLARRLLWQVGEGDDAKAVFPPTASAELADDAPARLWHVLDERDLDSVLVWRDLFAEQQVKQPFKQVWREAYKPDEPTTAADKRFVGHIIRQHVMRSLCQQRGWRYQLQGYWDSHNWPERVMPNHDIIAQLVADPVEHRSDDYKFNYLVTGPVRFYRGSEPRYDYGQAMSLCDVPPMVFSEVMRDVDLFVGAASVIGDPEFRAEELKGDYQEYWGRARWGELAPLAETRRTVLERLLPRTTLRDIATVEDRWLRLETQKGIYRIHLGSALVRAEGELDATSVVPDRKAKKNAAGVYLPFEEDSLLTIILAKAFTLAA